MRKGKESRAFLFELLLCCSASGSILIVVEGEGPLALHSRHVGPVVAGPREQHIPEQCLNGRLAHQAHEKQLLDDRRGDDAQRGQAEKEASKSVRLAGILVPHIFLESTLGLLLDALHMGDIRQAHSV